MSRTLTVHSADVVGTEKKKLENKSELPLHVRFRDPPLHRAAERSQIAKYLGRRPGFTINLHSEQNLLSREEQWRRKTQERRQALKSMTSTCAGSRQT